MKNSDYKIKTMSCDELRIAVDWAGLEGWNPGLYDIETFYTTDPKGFFLGLRDNKPVSCISAVSYGKDFGFLGFYIVKPEFRGQGYGIKIWNKAIEYLNTQNIGLDGVLAQQDNYKKSGFKLAYRNIRFQGKSNKSKNKNKNIINLSKIPFKELFKYDSGLFPSPRPKFLKKWIALPESTSLGYYKNNNLIGYGVIRKCKEGYKIGPLFADNKNIAESLFLALTNSITTYSTIFLDVPEPNIEALNLTKKYQMTKCFETARMYTKKPPDLALNKIFGVTTFELG